MSDLNNGSNITKDGDLTVNKSVAKEKRFVKKQAKLEGKDFAIAWQEYQDDKKRLAEEKAQKEAKGEYILFLDSDDLLNPETLEKAVEKIEEDKSDVVFFDWIRYYEDKGIYKKSRPKEFFGQGMLEGKHTIKLLSLKVYFTVSNLYSKKFLIEKNIFHGGYSKHYRTLYIISYKQQTIISCWA